MENDTINHSNSSPLLNPQNHDNIELSKNNSYIDNYRNKV